MRSRLFFSLLIITLLSGFAWLPTTAQSPVFYYSESTGHTINGAFLEFYLQATNPGEIYGEPITEAFIDRETNRLIQYFEKARFEYYPTDPKGRQVHATPLGLQHYLLIQEQAQTSKVFENSQVCQVFPDSGFKVCQGFLDFYEANGSKQTFGPPLSDAFWLNGRLVQYFFYSKLEWHPDLPTGKSILVSDLGYEFFFLNNENATRLDPLPKSNQDKTSSVSITLNARAIPEQAITSLQGRQTIYILVSDQRGLPVANAQAVILLRLPSGKESRYIVPQLTDQYGITKYSFPFKSEKVGMVEVKITITYEHLQANTTTSYRIWW